MDSSMMYPEFAIRQQHPPKRYNKARKNTFRKYCIRLFKESLITGFPALTSARIGPCRRLLKALVLVVCVCGFLYQTSEFLDMYFEYPTTLNMLVETPEDIREMIPVPAVGVCNRNSLRRTAMCTLEPDKCKWNQPDFCNRYPKYCIKLPQEVKPVNAVPNHPYHKQHNISLQYYKAVGQRYSDVVYQCDVGTDMLLSCGDIMENPVVNWEGYPNMCFTVESLWGLADSLPRNINPFTRVLIIVLLHPEEYVDHNETVMAHVMVHDPRALYNPIREGITLLPGKKYNIYVSQTVTKRLPAPYQTNCTDYLTLWRESGGYGPLTKKSCTEKCKMERSLRKFGCVPQSISYPNSETICDNIKVPSLEIMEGCLRECADACTESTYHLRVEEEADHRCRNNINCDQKFMVLYFLFNHFEVTTFVHEQKFESVEVFSYIGGYMGMWLGVSLVALFDLAETLVKLLVIYPLSQLKRRKARVAEFSGYP